MVHETDAGEAQAPNVYVSVTVKDPCVVGAVQVTEVPEALERTPPVADHE